MKYRKISLLALAVGSAILLTSQDLTIRITELTKFFREEARMVPWVTLWKAQI